MSSLTGYVKKNKKKAGKGPVYALVRVKNFFQICLQKENSYLSCPPKENKTKIKTIISLLLS